MEVGVQLSVTGSYLPPVFISVPPPPEPFPPQTIIKLPVQTAEWLIRGEGAFTVDVGDQMLVKGSYRLPVFSAPPKFPPQMIITLPVHTAEPPLLAVGRSSSMPLSHMSSRQLPPVASKLDWTDF